MRSPWGCRLLRLENERLLSEWNRCLDAENDISAKYLEQKTRCGELLAENERLTRERDALSQLLDTAETEDFDKAIPLEAAHQIKRWGTEHDSGKQPADWFWLVGYLAGKALASHLHGNLEKAKHHTISTAAALRNWHAHIRSGNTLMRPGIEEPIPPSTTQEPQSQGTVSTHDADAEGKFCAVCGLNWWFWKGSPECIGKIYLASSEAAAAPAPDRVRQSDKKLHPGFLGC